VTTKTDEAISAVLTRAVEAAQVTGEFVVEQAPDVVQQLLAWELTHSLVWALTLAAVITLVWKSRRWILTAGGDVPTPEDELTTGAIASVPTAMLAFPMITYILVGLKVLVAPKLFLLEYAASLIK